MVPGRSMVTAASRVALIMSSCLSRLPGSPYTAPKGFLTTTALGGLTSDVKASETLNDTVGMPANSMVRWINPTD